MKEYMNKHKKDQYQNMFEEDKQKKRTPKKWRSKYV